jgi:hypothetical protein
MQDNRKFISSRKYWLILLFYILIILIVFIISGQLNWIFFIIFSAAITLLCSLFFWQFFILSEIGLSKHFTLSKYIILNQLFRAPLVLSIKNGEIEGDYALLKKKPKIRILNIDSKSAILITDNKNPSALLHHGIHILRSNSNIVGCFYLGIRNIHIGPDDQNSLKPKNIQESIIEYHSRIKFSEQSKTQLLSGDFIYPSFTVFYRLELFGQNNIDLEILKNLKKYIRGNNLSLFTTSDLESFLVNEIISNWQNYCSNKNREEIFNEYSGKYEPTGIKIKGVIFHIYIDHIY